MTLYAVSYTYAPNSDAARDEYRPSHIEFLKGLFADGRLLTSGPTDPEGEHPGALLIVTADSATDADALMADDPFAVQGLLERSIREWRPFFGAERFEAAK